MTKTEKTVIINERVLFTVFLAMLLFFTCITQAQSRYRRDLGPSTLGVEEGIMEFETAKFQLKLLNSSQTVAGLKSANNPELDYTPGERLEQRDKDKFYHLGDINLAIQVEGDTVWSYFSTASERKNVTKLESDDINVLASADLSNTFPNDIPIQVIRRWKKEGENLVMQFELMNKSEKTIEIGALGIPLVFNNNYNNKSLDEAHAENTFFDPYIGKDAGYLQVVQLNGKSEVLLVVPERKTPFENYRPLLDDPTRIGYTFEGLHEWMAHSKAYSETEWSGVEQWNTPTSAILFPGESKVYGLKFLLAESLRDIENTLIENERPVAVGVPGYVIPMDIEGKLFLNYLSPVKSWLSEPEGAIELVEGNDTKHGWKSYVVRGKKWGRARLTINFENGTCQTISYKITEPEEEIIKSYGHFLTTEQWFDDEDDLFKRAPSVITYDYEEKKQVTQDARAWIPGLSDEGGAGSWLGAIMKQVVMPEKDEVDKLEDFVNQTIWGGIQYNEGERKYGVRKSMFYYEPDSMQAGTYSDSIRWGRYDGFPSWSKREAESVGRSYNYPHVAAAHWAMYRLARYRRGYVSQHDWKWYLENAFQTIIAMVEQAPHYAQFGQMEGTVFILILNDLKAEGLSEMANELEVAMKARVDHWASLLYPFGSEMPWDSTGQEEVYMWSKYFGLDEKAMVTLNAILAYMPSVPHWGYNGNARRIWDFLYGGKLTRFERMIHHYGSALNAIPVLYQYRENPSDFYLLRVGYGGLMGAISNITEDGFAPCAFHSFPQTMTIDGITGDYGTGFLGYAVNTSSYLFHHDEFGWLTFGANCTEKGDWVKAELTTAGRNRFYIAPVGLWLTLDAGRLKSVSYNVKNGNVELELEKADEYTPEAFLNINTPAREASAKEYDTTSLTKNELGSYTVELKDKPFTISLHQK